MEEEKEIMLKVDHVSKVYKLGEIGGTTIREELQRLKAKILKKEDPTKKIGAKDYNKGEKFKALDDISFEVRKGERIGIIGHNGAGKSTLLKLISRVTGPTSGNIYLNGRVASMLEVGTGFHGELTGRENIYMNGAILGMTKKEIDKKIEDIIEFSEVRQFIDTPVKRYSSGMYVKLAFSVAAHLDSEIVIMDEVLAVGDMAFQNKCISKMKSLSEEEDRTILYVSHNMSTIRQLCDRVIVLGRGKIVFDGDVEAGINCYLKTNLTKKKDNFFQIECKSRQTNKVVIDKLFLKNISNDIENNDPLFFSLHGLSYESFDSLIFRFTVFTSEGSPIFTTIYRKSVIANREFELHFKIDLDGLVSGDYYLKVTIYQENGFGSLTRHYGIDQALAFTVINRNMDIFDSEYLGHIIREIYEE